MKEANSSTSLLLAPNPSPPSPRKTLRVMDYMFFLNLKDSQRLFFWYSLTAPGVVTSGDDYSTVPLLIRW